MNKLRIHYIKMTFFLVAIAISGPSAWAKNKAGQPNLNCSQKHLQQKSCYLTLGKNRIQLWNDKIFLNDLIERDVQKIDLIEQDQSKVVEWQFARATQLKQRWFIELGLWGPPQTEGAIESLWWVVFEVHEGRLSKHFEKLIQKRKRLEDKKLKYDKIANYKLQLKENQVMWFINLDKGILK